MVENGKIELHDKVLIKNRFKSIVDGSDYQLNSSDDSDDFMYENIGKSISIEELIYRMMTVSSNLATNMLIEICQPQEITDFLRINNINGVQILRGVEDTKAFRAGLNNETTALGMLSMFEYIDKLPSGISKSKLMNILFNQKFNDIIPAKIPKDVKVAHKTGSIVGVQHDTGIVYLPDGKKYAMILLSKQLKDEKKGIEVLSNISKMVYDYVAQ
jgi:beta-lactamase class A